MTEFLFRSESYRQTLEASVTAVTPEGGIVLDRTIFYANSGGQPGDTGTLTRADGTRVAIAATVHPGGDKAEIMHVPVDGQPALAPGDAVTAQIDWPRRLALMRMHSGLHLLSVVFPFPVTGGSVGETKGRLDFDMPEIPENLDVLEAELNAMIVADHPISEEWISDAEMAAQPELTKTMKVKPPMGQGRVRLIRIGTLDLQPCGGTHVARTGEIGPLKLAKIEKKGAHNRRVSVVFAA